MCVHFKILPCCQDIKEILCLRRGEWHDVLEEFVFICCILSFFGIIFPWLFWWLLEMPALLCTFCLDGQRHYLSSLILLLGHLYLKHYSGRINTPKLVLHPLVRFMWRKPGCWASSLWWACCMLSVWMRGNSPSSSHRHLCVSVDWRSSWAL